MLTFVGRMFMEIGACFRLLADDANVRAVVLSGGQSKHFSAGLDCKC
jgi:enoyl-CoA hydratase/carnithine racemase